MWRAETASGTYFAKQNTPQQAIEARLLTLLGELAPVYVVPLVAADPDRDLLLTPDQGPVLGDTLADASEDDLLPVIRRMLGEGAQLQREVAPHAGRLTQAGLERLAPALPAALRLARLSRCESWIRCFAGMNDAELAEWGDAAAYWLAEVATST